MQRNIDKWIYTIECANPEGNEDLSKDSRFNIFGWKWSKGYDSVDAIGKLYTRGEAVDMVFNKHYTFVKYLVPFWLLFGCSGAASEKCGSTGKKQSVFASFGCIEEK